MGRQATHRARRDEPGGQRRAVRRRRHPPGREPGSGPRRALRGGRPAVPGVAPGERDRIFERFYRGQTCGPRGVTNGTGLGLSLVAEHVRLHGGRVWAESGADGENRFVDRAARPATTGRSAIGVTAPIRDRGHPTGPDRDRDGPGRRRSAVAPHGVAVVVRAWPDAACPSTRAHRALSRHGIPFGLLAPTTVHDHPPRPVAGRGRPSRSSSSPRPVIWWR